MVDRRNVRASSWAVARDHAMEESWGRENLS